MWNLKTIATSVRRKWKFRIQCLDILNEWYNIGILDDDIVNVSVMDVFLDRNIKIFISIEIFSSIYSFS